MPFLANILSSTLLAAGLLVPVPVRAEGPAPVRIERCSFSTWSLSPERLTGALHVGFAVTGGVAADRVDVHVSWGDGHESDLTDAGRFRPGASVFHPLEFHLIGTVGNATFQRIDLQVTRVHLTDGSVWETAAGNPGPQARCTVYPS